MMRAPNRLLVMDDEASFCTFVAKAAAKLGYEVKYLTDSVRFIETVQEFSPSVLMIDLQMPGCDGVQLLQSLEAVGSRARVLVASGMDHRVLEAAKDLGQSHGLSMLGVLQKPIKLADLRAALNDAMGSAGRYTRDELKEAIERCDLAVHYQPKVSLRNGIWSATGAEALVRWNHPTHGFVSPAEFVPLAEESGLIGLLTDRVLDTAIGDLADWRGRGLDLNISANLSAWLMGNLEFPDRLAELLSHHGVPGSSLTLELTETAAMADPSRAMDILLRLRVNRVELAIDDFGTGYSSLKQLYQLPFDVLKIDRTFVMALPGDDEARAIVRATIDMAHALNMRVCAEGVETQGALDFLESAGCDELQGFLIGRAVPAAELEQAIDRWHRQMPELAAQ